MPPPARPAFTPTPSRVAAAESPAPRSAPPPPVATPPQPPVSTATADRPSDPGASIARLRKELDDAKKAASAGDARIRDLEASAAKHDARIKEIQASSEEQIAARDARIRELEAALSARDRRIGKLEEASAAALAQQAELGDDLKKIRGVGPAMERELRRLGITTFAQIAAWTPEDVDTIGKKIKAKPERIRRENWIESAATLAKGSSESS